MGSEMCIRDRNYGWAANLSGQLASGALSLTSGVLELGQKLTFELPEELGIPEWAMPFVMSQGGLRLTAMTSDLRKGIDAIDKINEDLLNGLEKPREFKDINNAEEFGEWFGHLATSQAANTAITFSTGGASLFILGASSTCAISIFSGSFSTASSKLSASSPSSSVKTSSA